MSLLPSVSSVVRASCPVSVVGELSSECGASCLLNGASCLLNVGRVVLGRVFFGASCLGASCLWGELSVIPQDGG